MSGDVQPKKRRDKRKKKEDHQEEVIHQPPPTVTQPVNVDDTNIHVHKEKSVGGGICAKCVFLIITLAIAIILGFTIVEHRGLTDIDIPLSESRFASIFEGWIDTEKSDHDDHHEEVSFDHDEDASHEEDDEDEGIGSEEEEEEEDHEEEESEQEPEESEQELEESEQEPDDEDEQQEESEQEEEDEEIESPEIQAESNEEEQEESEEKQQVDESEEPQEESQEPQDESQEPQDESQEPQEESEEQQEESEAEDSQEEQPEGSQEENEREESEEDQKDTSKEEDQQDENEENNVANAASTGGVTLPGDQESESDDDKAPKKRSGAQSYEYENITNEGDFLIKESLDYAQQHLPNNVALAINLFVKILENDPQSPRALYGRALALDHLAEQKRSNEILQESIKYFTKVLNAKNVPDALFLAAATRCIERMRFIGNYAKAIDIHQKLIVRFPDEIKHRNDFSVTLLTINRISDARSLLIETLRKWPNDGFALVHYGFILKTIDNNLPLAIDYLTKGISTKEPGVVDGRFYFHLGDALARIGKPEEAIKIYEDGVNTKIFLSKYQRSLYNVDRLTGKPWWRIEDTPYSTLHQRLQENWREIRKEGLLILDKKGYFKDESENLKDVGDWKQFELYARGAKNKANCLKCPITCQIIDSLPEARSCRRGQVKFSVMHPGTHVWPHCGPTNCRLRVHLGLKVPPKTYIRVAEETRSWEEGKIIIFDDSFEHEVWHNGTEYRLVLIVDVWHPELTKSERINLSPI